MKNLIVYFTWSNNTKKLVLDINKEFNFDILRIDRKKPYSENYNTCAYVEAKEEVSKHIFPEISDFSVDFNEYNNILLFFPIWWYTFPMVIGTFIKKIKGFKGNVYYFANSYTNDYQYMINVRRDLLKIDSSINFKEGLFNKNLKDHIDFIRREVK